MIDSMLREFPYSKVPNILQAIEDFSSINNIINRMNPHCSISYMQMLSIRELQRSLKDVYILLRQKFDVINYMLSNSNDYLEKYLVNNKGYVEYLYNKAEEDMKSLTFIVINLKKDKKSSSIQQEGDTFKGTEWVRDLFNIYLKYNTDTNVTCLQFFKNLRAKWNLLSDYETIVISNITEDILGGKSLEYISLNFKDWIKCNRDVTLPFQFMPEV